jgi:hypothetical protein
LKWKITFRSGIEIYLSQRQFNGRSTVSSAGPQEHHALLPEIEILFYDDAVVERFVVDGCNYMYAFNCSSYVNNEQQTRTTTHPHATIASYELFIYTEKIKQTLQKWANG